MVINPKYTRRSMRAYPDSYEDVNATELALKRKEYIVVFLENDTGYPPKTLVTIQMYSHRTGVPEEEAKVDEKSAWVNLLPEDAICFANDIYRLVSAMFDIGNHTLYVDPDRTKRKFKKKDLLEG